jgi:hypothetical protein
MDDKWGVFEWKEGENYDKEISTLLPKLFLNFKVIYLQFSTRSPTVFSNKNFQT